MSVNCVEPRLPPERAQPSRCRLSVPDTGTRALGLRRKQQKRAAEIESASLWGDEDRGAPTLRSVLTDEKQTMHLLPL
ncbi:hypothetical protein F2P81_004645 [Scophthalmus maximus]|uniref:Uncharacterized protein n=1 Tax=Scophthalmus maximus TaxID=52904 RepID=A0A6A4TFU7_SCOMX|nr:hypothetical protein F2P81_004645 [Scophthalmus maximus]